MLKTHFKYSCSALVLFCLPFSVQADAYKWTDPEGFTNYSQTPPIGIEVKKIPIQKIPAVTPEQSQQAVDILIEQQTATDAAKQKQRVEDAEKRDRANKFAKNCHIAKNNLKKYQDNPHGRRINANGETERVDEIQRQQRIAQLQKDIATYCL